MQPQPRSYLYLMKRLFALTGAVFLLAGCGDKTRSQKRTLAPLPVEVVEVGQGPITEYVAATGRIEPYVRVRLATKLQGRVEEVNFEEGQAVEPGQLLVKIDAADVRARKAQAEAARAQAAASLRQLDASKREARAMLKNAQGDHDRMKSLHDNKVATPSSTTTLSPVWRLRGPGSKLFQAQGEVLLANMAAAEGQIQEADALLAYAGLTLAHGRGGDGEKRRGRRHVNSRAPLLVLEDLSRVKVELVVAEGDIRYVRLGLEAAITVDALPGRRLTGAVDTVIPSGDPLSHAFVVQVVFENPRGVLLPGMFARAGIVKEHREDVSKVPLDAVLEEGDQRFVFRVENGRAVRVNIQTGLQDSTSAEVVEGLAPGDQVVTRGKENLTSHSAVRIVNEIVNR